MLDPEALKRLRNRKNLLAFSAGVDSTALYHLLKEWEIPFDIALINYKTRPESDEEESHARKLAKKDAKKAFILQKEVSGSHFEKKARKIRYDYFERVIEKEGYENLVTAHQLDDLLEWGLMQLCKGCGLVEFVGMQPVEQREHYTLVRPLLFTPRKKLLSYLRKRGIRYFVDVSNLDTRYTRNLFRERAAKFLMEECGKGIAESFRYMLADKAILLPEPDLLYREKELTLFRPQKTEESILIRWVDKILKEQGYLLSKAQKEEILRNRSVVVGGAWVVEVGENLVWIAPYRQIAMPKSFRERCRKARIPKKIRPYLFENVDFEKLFSSLSNLSS